MTSQGARASGRVLTSLLAGFVFASSFAVVNSCGVAAADVHRLVARQPSGSCHTLRSDRSGSIATGVLLVVTVTRPDTPYSLLTKFELATAIPAVGGCFLYVRNEFGTHSKAKWFVRKTEPQSRRLLLIRYLRRVRLFSKVRVVGHSST